MTHAVTIGNMHLLIITPIFLPTTGGAATYYELLTESLLASGEVSEITVLTERVPGSPTRELRNDGHLRVIRLFPYRAGRNLGRFALYWRYGLQNLQYLILPRLVATLKPDVMLVHASFHIYFNTLHFLIRDISCRLPIVADVRDHLLHTSRLAQLNHYSALIACSLNVKAHVSQFPALAAKTTHIPVIQERITSNRPLLPVTLAKHGLRHRGYFLYAGLIKQAKGVELLLSVFSELRERGLDAELVLAGFSKDDALIAQAKKIHGVRHIGAVSREEILNLMAGALMSVNLSKSEGMPRSSLEALALGVPVLLPSGIPEFNQYCAECVVRSNQPQEVADQVQALLSTHNFGQIYPVAMHERDSVLARYIELFRSLVTQKTAST